MLTSLERVFYIEKYIRDLNINQFVHFDNDVVLFESFDAIKNNFTEAKTEIDDIQSNKANLNAINNFSGNTIQNAVLKDNGETTYAHGSVASGSVALNHENGHYQTLTITANTTFSFLNFPTGSLGRMILDITVAPTSTGVLTFPTAVIKAHVHGHGFFKVPCPSEWTFIPHIATVGPSV